MKNTALLKWHWFSQKCWSILLNWYDSLSYQCYFSLEEQSFELNWWLDLHLIILCSEVFRCYFQQKKMKTFNILKIYWFFFFKGLPNSREENEGKIPWWQVVSNMFNLAWLPSFKNGALWSSLPFLFLLWDFPELWLFLIFFHDDILGTRK